jgi:hypothetical protein
MDGAMPEDPLPLWNVYEVKTEDGRTQHLLTFLQADRAAAGGIEPRSIVGEVTPTDFGGFDPLSLNVNPEFIEALTTYMNEVVALTPAIVEQARACSVEWTYVVDPRNHDTSGEAPPPTDVLGAFGVNKTGDVVVGSFIYNHSHALIDQEKGFSGIFSDQRFYDWLHPPVEPT